jgi:photosystem II stability/assembly factor-like uncharacterized protein
MKATLAPPVQRSTRACGRRHSWRAAAALLAVLALALLLAGCGESTASAAYGGPQNHLHDVLALRGVPHTVLLATHIGLYRSADGGGSWHEVAGGAGQAMDGLMLFKLAQSAVDSQRVYVLAIKRTDNPAAARATTGIYTSGDAGQTWQLATSLAAFPTQTVFTIATGTASAGQVFAIVPGLGDHGLYASDDAGGHWRALAQTPTTTLTGIAGDPSNPRHLLLWSVASGLFTSGDAGASWAPAGNMSGGIYSVSMAAKTVYASGDAGLYISQDGGGHFALAHPEDTFSQVVVCAVDATHAYALTGTAVFATTDSGQTWRQTAPTSRHPGLLTVDPAAASGVYVGLSYPLGVEATTTGGTLWRTVLP